MPKYICLKLLIHMGGSPDHTAELPNPTQEILVSPDRIEPFGHADENPTASPRLVFVVFANIPWGKTNAGHTEAVQFGAAFDQPIFQ